MAVMKAQDMAPVACAAIVASALLEIHWLAGVLDSAVLVIQRDSQP